MYMYMIAGYCQNLFAVLGVPTQPERTIVILEKFFQCTPLQCRLAATPLTTFLTWPQLGELQLTQLEGLQRECEALEASHAGEVAYLKLHLTEQLEVSM